MPRIYPIPQLDKKTILKLQFPEDPPHALNLDPGVTLLKKLHLSRVLEEMNQMTRVVIAREIVQVENLYHMSLAIDILTSRQVRTQYSALHFLLVRRKREVILASEEDLLAEGPDPWIFHLLIDDAAIDLVRVPIREEEAPVAEEAPLELEEEVVVAAVGEDRGGPVPPLNLRGHGPGEEIVAVGPPREVLEVEIEITDGKGDARLDHLEVDLVHNHEEVVQVEVKVDQYIEVVVVEVEIDGNQPDLVDQIAGAETIEEESQEGLLHLRHHHHPHKLAHQLSLHQPGEVVGKGQSHPVVPLCIACLVETPDQKKDQLYQFSKQQKSLKMDVEQL